MDSAALDRALAPVGLTLAELQRTATEVVLFGSRAAGVARGDSDWDFLCVGHGQSRAVRGIDLVWISSEQANAGDWLGSELAGHVASWGRWIWGAPRWRREATASRSTVERKARRVYDLVRALERTWDGLPELHRREQLTLLRRDIQRYCLLSKGQVVPPTAHLDRSLDDAVDDRRTFFAAADTLGIRSHLEWFSASLARPRGDRSDCV